MRKHKCPAIGCNAQIKVILAFCAKHWAMVPRPIQHRIWGHWRAANWEEHKEAVRDAIQAIQKAP